MKTVTVRLTRIVRQTETMTVDIPVTYDEDRSLKDPVGLAMHFVESTEDIGNPIDWVMRSRVAETYPRPRTEGKVMSDEEPAS